MNAIAKKLLLAGAQSMLERYLIQLGFTYSPCGPKIKEMMKKMKEMNEDISFKTNQIELAFNMIWNGDFNDLTKITAIDKVLRHKAFNIVTNTKDDISQHRIKSIVNKFLIKNKIISNQDIADELDKTIIRKFQKQNVHSSFEDNILGANLADMQVIG